MIHLARGDLHRAEQAPDHAANCGAVIQPGLALLEVARGDLHGAASMIDAALTDAALDPLRRLRLLPAAIQIATASGHHPAERLTELQQLTQRYRP